MPSWTDRPGDLAGWCSLRRGQQVAPSLKVNVGECERGVCISEGIEISFDLRENHS